MTVIAGAPSAASIVQMLELPIASAIQEVAGSVTANGNEFCNYNVFLCRLPALLPSVELYLRSQLAEDASAANFAHALGVGLAHITLHALVVGVAVGAHVAFQQGETGNCGVAHRVAFAHGAGGQRTMGK